MTNARLAALVVVFLLAGLPATLVAQEQEGPLAAMQTKEALTDDDRAGIRTWIGQQIAGLADKDPPQRPDGVQSAARQRAGYAGVHRGVRHRGHGGHRVGVQEDGHFARRQLIALLNVFDDRRSADLLLEALKDDRAAVRAAAIIALRNLQPKVAADADLYGRTLAALKEAGKREVSRETLRLIYRAMDYAKVQPAPDRRQAAAALLELLEYRVGKYGEANVPAEGAEVEALTGGKEWRKSLDEAQRKRYALLLAKLLHYGVGHYTGGERPLGQVRDKTDGPDMIALRNATELLIEDAEAQLTEMLSPSEPPNVTDAMRRAKKTERAHMADIILEMNKWAPTFKEKLELDLAPLNAPPPPDEKEKP